MRRIIYLLGISIIGVFNAVYSLDFDFSKSRATFNVQVLKSIEGNSQYCWGSNGQFLVILRDIDKGGEEAKECLQLRFRDRNEFESKLLFRRSDIQFDSPAISPDGQKVAFSGFSNYESAIYILNLQNMEWKKVTKQFDGAADPTWSPNGEALLFSALQNDRWALLEVNLASAMISPVSENYWDHENPIWLLEDLVVYVGGYSRLKSLHSVQVSGVNDKCLAFENQYCTISSYSSSDSAVIVSVPDYNNRSKDRNMVLKLPNQQLDIVIKDNGLTDGIALSPDGNYIAFVSMGNASIKTKIAKILSITYE